MGYLQSRAKPRTQRLAQLRKGGKLLPMVRRVAPIRFQDPNHRGSRAMDIVDRDVIMMLAAGWSETLRWSLRWGMTRACI